MATPKCPAESRFDAGDNGWNSRPEGAFFQPRIGGWEFGDDDATPVNAMSRAFVKDVENVASEVLDRPISPHRNFVTEAGLAAIEAALARFEATHRAATDKGDREGAASALREVRYWRARRASAEVVKRAADKSKASFGMSVTLRRDDGREQNFRIVGEDEADPSRGTVSYASPLARAVLTHGSGEVVEIAGREAVIVDVR